MSLSQATVAKPRPAYLRDHHGQALTREYEDDDESVDAAVHDQMSFVYFKYLEQTSRTDTTLSDSQRTLLCDSAATHTKEILTRRICSQRQLDSGSRLVENLQGMGDRFDSFLDSNPRLNQAIETAMEGTDGQPDADSLIQYLSDVVTNVFECDEDGHAQNINLGRVVVVFCYCYRAVKSFVLRAYNTNSLFSFMVSLASYLIKTLLKVKFQEWLQQQEGIQHTIVTTFLPDVSSLLSRIPRGLIVTGGVIVLAYLAYRAYNARQ